jgi:hypothetical protein
MNTGKSIRYEIWEKKNAVMMQGKSYSVLGTEITFRRGVITYSPAVIRQNNGVPIPFTMVKKSDSEGFIFENATHDFSQRITYQFTDARSLVATISGNTKKGYREIPFRFTRQ